MSRKTPFVAATALDRGTSVSLLPFMSKTAPLNAATYVDVLLPPKVVASFIAAKSLSPIAIETFEPAGLIRPEPRLDIRSCLMSPAVT